jgi:hypothetical protein
MRLDGRMSEEVADAIFRQLARMPHDVHLVVTQRTRNAPHELDASVDLCRYSQSERWSDESTLRVKLSRQFKAAV